MSYSIFRFTLNMHNHRSQASLKVFKGDTAVKLIITLTDGGNIYKIVRGCTATLTGTKPNGEKLKHSCSIEGDTIIYIFDNETADQAGLATCEITLYDENGRVITAPKFTMDVAVKEVEGTDPISEYSSAAIATVMGAAAGEYARQEAESARQANEEQRQELYNRAETVANEAKAIADNAVIIAEGAVRAVDESSVLYGNDRMGKASAIRYSDLPSKETIVQRGKHGNIAVEDNPVKTSTMMDYETGELLTELDKHAAINTIFADKRYGRKIVAEYNNQNGTLKICLQNDGNETISEYDLDLPLESSIVEIDEVEKDGKLYLRLTLASGNTTEVELDDLFRGFVKSVSDKNILYGTDAEGNPIHYLVTSDANDVSGDYRRIIPTKHYINCRNQVYRHTISSGVKSGWFTIAKRTETSTGEGRCGNIFKLDVYVANATVNGTTELGGSCSTLFSLDMAEWNSPPAISVLSYTYRDTPAIKALRVVRENGKLGAAYVQVLLDKVPEGSKRIIFKTETLLYDYIRYWELVKPAYDTVSAGCTITEKSITDSAWSSVNVGAEYLNNLPSKITELEEQINSLAPPVSEYISMLPYLQENDAPNINLLLQKGKKFSFGGNWRLNDLIDGYGGLPWQVFEALGWIDFAWEWTPDTVPSYEPDFGGGVAGTVSNFTASLDNSDCTLISASASRMIASFHHYDVDNGYNTYVECSLDIEVVIKENSTGTEYTCTYGELYWDYHNNEWYEGRGDGCLEYVHSYIEKTPETSHFFPSTMDFRTQSIDRQLKASLEENRARIAEEFKYKYNGEEQ